MRSRGDAAKRVLDLLGAAVGLVLLAPVMFVVATAILLQSGRPVFFRQVRAGKGARPFTIWKFRTMDKRTVPEDVALSESDPRISKLGHLLRTTSLDELPQLINVLLGHMSLVGPRPTIPEQVERYSAHERRRLEVAPGITGWAQVNGRNTLSWEERIDHDVWYVDHRSVALDLRIIGRTLGVLLQPDLVFGGGSKGVTE